MNSIEFGKKCQPLNIKYRDLFNIVPCRDDYACSQDEYYNALIKSIKNKKEIDNYLKRKSIQINDKNIKI